MSGDHEITCCYAGGPGYPYYQPQMDCSCGYSTGRCEDWAEAGLEIDKHIAEIREREERVKVP